MEKHLVAGAPVTDAPNRVLFWWPVPLAIVAAMLAQRVLLAPRSDVGGHAAEHLAGASAPFMSAALIAVLFWATPSARRQLDAILAAAAWFASTVVVMVGNLRVVDDLVRAGHARTPTGQVPDVADHSLANSSIWYAVGAATIVVAVFVVRRHIGAVGACGAAAAMIFPPWIIPGAGIVVLTIVRCVAHGRSRHLTPEIDVRRSVAFGDPR
jgi:hypothetical protein